jgi:hypothetical protein
VVRQPAGIIWNNQFAQRGVCSFGKFDEKGCRNSLHVLISSVILDGYFGWRILYLNFLLLS